MLELPRTFFIKIMEKFKTFYNILERSRDVAWTNLLAVAVNPVDEDGYETKETVNLDAFQKKQWTTNSWQLRFIFVGKVE